MYIATLDNRQEVVVKFTTRYNEDAHRLLVGHQLAPTLHFCGRVIGNLYMVVMDLVDGKSIWQLQMEGTPVPPVVSKKVEGAVVETLGTCGTPIFSMLHPRVMKVVSFSSILIGPRRIKKAPRSTPILRPYGIPMIYGNWLV